MYLSSHTEFPSSSNPLIDVPHVIQLAIAPVFLLTSIGTILSVLSHRLARIVDRMRVLMDRLDEPQLAGPQRLALEAEVWLLRVRRKFVHQAIMFGTMAAIFVALLIVTAFVGALATANVSVVLAVLSKRLGPGRLRQNSRALAPLEQLQNSIFSADYIFPEVAEIRGPTWEKRDLAIFRLRRSVGRGRLSAH